ncbi:dihydroorotase [Candidatus Photodesmus blepharus]|uniref:Dihydroorotase n=1 Tax=Candidatus Photodesmus blepharonis TaxID=1179155 RepID=A0A084CNB7_9GAMM|nr:dihydroorotase [Candidatus Photodesmus blepharus]KEY91296.1 dihydroorotase [Candidatus Photodesmus blepharus]
MTTLTITRPDDWHVHLRDGEILADTVRDISRYNGRALVMPNLSPPITTTQMALAYRTRIMEQKPCLGFEPLMALYLTDKSSDKEIRLAKKAGIVAAKLYPVGSTTNSESGVTSIKNIYSVLRVMQEVGMLLLIHGEVTTCSIDIFDREKEFLHDTLGKIINNFPDLRIVLEHITTADAVSFIRNAGDNIASTITVHHLLYNRNHMLVGGIKPHFYCAPVLKRDIHQKALIEAATSGDKKFFLGSDSAPHAKSKKEASSGCAGLYTAHAALELYAEVFEKEDKLGNFEAFASYNGADFYGVPRNQDSVTLIKEEWLVEDTMSFGRDILVPIRSRETVNWRVK